MHVSCFKIDPKAIEHLLEKNKIVNEFNLEIEGQKLLRVFS
jgi:hypothetical protein